MLEITAKQAEAIIHHDTEDFKIIEDLCWEDDGGKYSYGCVVFQPITSNRFYRLTMRRAGSYFTDYYYEYEDVDHFDCEEVEQVEITKTIWRNKGS